MDVFSGAKQRHLFFRLMRVYCELKLRTVFFFYAFNVLSILVLLLGKQYSFLAIFLILYTLAGFVSPIGIYQLLKSRISYT